jgi:hypothetical protein
MRRYLITALGAGALALASTGAMAMPLNSYTLNFSAASSLLGAAIPDLNNVDEWQFLARSVVAFQDNDLSGGISTGDNFYDWVAVRVTGFTNVDGDDITPAGYGATAASTHEITLIARFGGVQTGANTYSVTFIDQFDFFFDAGGGFTFSTFNDLDSFSDGVLVETADLIAGGGNNTGPLNITGSLEMLLTLNDVLSTNPDTEGEFFEVDDEGMPFPMELILGIVDSDNTPQAPFNIAEFASYFGFTYGSFDAPLGFGLTGPDGTAFDFFIASSNDGSFNKAIVPEPGTMILLGSGLLGLAGVARRRQKS